MQPPDVLFGDFRLDQGNECLWQGTRAISLRPKAFAVLKLLVANSGHLVTKRQVLDAVWPGTFVGEAVLKDSIRQLREALGDDAESPSYIQTAHRRGYRFIASPSLVGNEGKTRGTSVPVAGSGPTTPSAGVARLPSASALLGRESELASLRGWLERAMRGERRVVFVSGEAGIGKTTLVQAFLDEAGRVPGVRVARGQCLEHYGAGEAYLPVLDGMTRLGRAASGQVVGVLRQHAPAWLAQMPSFILPGERESLQAQVMGATRERMLREMAEATEVLAADAPLLLVLEDLHWSDCSTLDLLAYLARRPDPARLMVIGTYRPVEVVLGEHPLKGVKRELQAHGLCDEISLGYLTEETVASYLDVRFPRHYMPRRLARMVHRRTEGNPLFMVNAVEYLVAERVITEEDGTWKLRADPSDVERGVPDNLKQLIERQIERLGPDERTVLEAASVVGMECSSVAIAAGLDVSTEWVERHCEELARRHRFLSPAWLVELPDGTITPRHRFNHTLYLEVAYNLVPPMRRSQIHRRIAERGVAIYGERSTEIAAELAMHFEQSREWPRALQYLSQAADTATRRSAHHEARALATRGLEVLRSLPESPARVRQEITLRLILGASLMATKGFAAPEVAEVYDRARELCWQQGSSPELFGMLWSLGLFYIFSGEMQGALELAGQLLQLARDLEQPALVMEAHRAMGVTLVDLGRCREALAHLEEAARLYEASGRHAYAVFIGHDCKVVSGCFAARALWALGYPDRALQRVQEALALARELSHPQTLVVATHFAAQLHQLRGEPLRARERAREVVAWADEYGLELWLAFGNIDLGWSEAELGESARGIERMRRGLAAYEATGACLWRPHFLGLLARALGKAGRVDEARAAVTEAVELAGRSGERYSTPELHRLKGELILRGSRPATAGAGTAGKAEEAAAPGVSAEALGCFEEGLRTAREQDAKSWELRALTSVGRCLQEDGSPHDARRALRETYAWFEEGRETADLQEARMVLEGPAEA
jgi:DNA-binding winged helix-turn-helix (wHTH) protein/tetratricopeptide (TPR) repeat protein